MSPRGSSRQDYGTPPEFLQAVRERFGRPDVDLAATEENRAALFHLGPGSGIAEDSLAYDWSELEDKPLAEGPQLWWLNPPFADISPWAARCASVRHRRAWTLLLVPASVGSEWYAEHVHGRALVMFLRPRLTFVGCADPYPRDLLLAAYGFGAQGFECWRWRTR